MSGLFNEKDVLVFAQVYELCAAIWHDTGRKVEAVVLHPAYCVGYTQIHGMPVIRSEYAPKDRPLVAWGRE